MEILEFRHIKLDLIMDRESQILDIKVIKHIKENQSLKDYLPLM